MGKPVFWGVLSASIRARPRPIIQEEWDAEKRGERGGELDGKTGFLGVLSASIRARPRPIIQEEWDAEKRGERGEVLEGKTGFFMGFYPRPSALVRVQ